MSRAARTGAALATLALGSSGCALSGTWLNHGLEPGECGALVASAGARMAPGRWRNIGFDAGARVYQVPDSIVDYAGHANVLIDVYEPLYGFSGIGYGSGVADRTWEVGLGAQIEVALTPTGPLAAFVELGYGEVYAEVHADVPVAIPIAGSFLRIGATWCPSLRLDC